MRFIRFLLQSFSKTQRRNIRIIGSYEGTKAQECRPQIKLKHGPHRIPPAPLSGCCLGCMAAVRCGAAVGIAWSGGRLCSVMVAGCDRGVQGEKGFGICMCMAMITLGKVCTVCGMTNVPLFQCVGAFVHGL